MGVTEQPATNEYLAALCTGLDVYKAKNRLLSVFPQLSASDIDILFVDCAHPRFLVLACAFDKKTGTILLTASSRNLIRYLPSNYQTNDFLRKFLMIFQHIHNETAITLDNLYRLFLPMECPSEFLLVLADWFGINPDTLGGENEIRLFLQYAVPLFRFRGTTDALRAYMAIVSGTLPRIIEGRLPYSSLEITDDRDITETNLFEATAGKDCFTVYFPVYREQFDDALVRRLSLIIQQEKPAHTRCFICFKKHTTKKRKMTTIDSATAFDSDAGIRI